MDKKEYKRKVMSGGHVNITGTVYQHQLLIPYHGLEVTLKGITRDGWHGYDIYRDGKWICFLRTHNYNTN